MAMTLEPKGKLGTTGVVNGPEGGPGSWESVSWLSAKGNVRRLRQRIFTASQAGDLKRVRNLQKLTAPVPVERAGGRFPAVCQYCSSPANGNADTAVISAVVAGHAGQITSSAGTLHATMFRRLPR